MHRWQGAAGHEDVPVEDPEDLAELERIALRARFEDLGPLPVHDTTVGSSGAAST